MCQKYVQEGVYEGAEQACQKTVAAENEPKDDF